MCVSFHTASKEVCNTLALFARHICTEHVDPWPQCLTAFIACRLISLNKQPGVHPIGACEYLCQIIGKAVLTVVRPYIQATTAALQLCADQDVGIEAAVHAMHSTFEDSNTDAVLLVYAKRLQQPEQAKRSQEHQHCLPCH